MRTSPASRAVIAVASLAIGSAALAAVPAGAATRSGITRDMTLAAAAGVRAAPSGSTAYSAATTRTLKALSNRACAIDPDGTEVYLGAIAGATAPGGSADGVVVTAVLGESNGTEGVSASRICTFGALAAAAGRSTLSGTATVNAKPFALAGDVFVTPGVRTQLTIATSQSTAFPLFKASGNAIRSVTVKVKDVKTSKQKKAAKKKYVKRLAAAKKVYAKALRKAGSSTSKKAAAKKTYRAKRASAKATYRYAIASYKLSTQKIATPFSVTAQAEPPS